MATGTKPPDLGGASDSNPTPTSTDLASEQTTIDLVSEQARIDLVSEQARTDLPATAATADDRAARRAALTELAAMIGEEVFY